MQFYIVNTEFCDSIMLHFQMMTTIKCIYRMYILYALYYIGGTAQFTSPKGTVVCDSLSKELRTNHPRH